MIALPIVTDEEVKKQLHALSEREYDTLRRFAQGQSCADIAAYLGLSIKTIDSFRARLMGKLQLTSTNQLVRYAVKHEADMTRPPATDEPGPPSLSKRECEVLAWFVDGRSCTDIGARMGISSKTVQTYRTRIMDKLQLTNTMQLIRYAIESELDRPLSVPAQPTPRPVTAPAVVAPMMSAPMPMAYSSHSYEREEWPG